MTANGHPGAATTTPAAPLTNAGWACTAPSRANVQRPLRPPRAPRHDHRRARTRDAAVGAQHDVGVEHRDQRVEVAAPGRGEEGIDHLALPGEVRVGNGRRALDPPPGPARQLPGRRRRPAHDQRRSRRTAPRTCRAARTPAAPRERARPAPRAGRARPSRRATPPAPGRPRPPVTIGSGTCTASGSSRRDRRDRSMFRHTRATTVVSQPPRFSMLPASDRLSRSQASCTASSASVSEPSIRYATARSWAGARRTARPASRCSSIGHIPSSGRVIAVTYETLSM